MAVSGFEGFEKRLELYFSGDDPAAGNGLRRLNFYTIEKILHTVQCTVVSAVGNDFFDSYVLSESSLFVYPTKIIIKTCGTTQLLKSLRPLVESAATVGLTLSGCRYTRGTFIFPGVQPFPHTSFKDEVFYLEENLPDNLVYRKAAVLGPRSAAGEKWHVFSACDDSCTLMEDDSYTVEICMTELDRVLAKKFFRRFDDRRTGDSVGKEMTDVTGIRDVNRKALICDYAFDPCGYSMNGLAGGRYSTVHVTPEDDFSYASFECVGSVYDDREEFLRLLQKVVKVFRPAKLSVATTCPTGNDFWKGTAKTMESLGMRLRSRAADEFPGAGTVVFQAFSSRRN
ncbi:S-adenosylmethionine decarboxylase proenzyme 4 [Andrographis paniculata]|uniref:S-adenosylmethionine decarboxylase proenzyme 4 n=1 Tax=Andrographis paniculata TaxID=175694 RepID=UPI0021E9A7A2|nr:S-adenosylmethionine decarboxylase proenzyme 4 [Andrographis paniculata]